jgi:TolB-like protein
VRQRAYAIRVADVTARAAVTHESTLDVTRIPARSFAVLPFTATGGDSLLTPLRFALPALLMSDLAVSPSLRLVDRLATDAVLRETQLIDAGAVDPRGAPRVGRLVGARRLLLGEVTYSGPTRIRISARVVDVLAGTVQELVSAEAPLDRVIDAERALAVRLFEQLDVTLTPAQRAKIEQQQPVQLAAVVAYGRGVDAEAHGDVPRAQAAFAEAAKQDRRFASAPAAPPIGTAPPSLRAADPATRIEQVTALGVAALNAPLPTKLPEAADAPLSPSTALAISILVRVRP